MSLLQGKSVSRVFSDGKGDEVVALAEVSISVSQGDFVGISGESGSGKSTLLNLLSGLDMPTTGKVEFNGQNYCDISTPSLAALRNKFFGYIFQTPHMVFHKSVIENIMLPWLYSNNANKKTILQRADFLLQYVGLAGFHNRKPMTLSGGELQRIVFARALLLEPQIIFADEPSASLDENNSFQLMSLLKDQVLQGRTVIMVSHDPQALKFADSIININKASNQQLDIKNSMDKMSNYV